MTNPVIASMISILTPPGVWIKGTLCTTASGDDAVEVDKADCFCLFGAEIRAERLHPRIDRSKANYFVRRAIRELFPGRSDDSVPQFNDHPATTHADVLAVLNRALEMDKR